MIAYEAFVQNFKLGRFTRVNFSYEDEEYVLARETDPETGEPVFVYADEKGSSQFSSFGELLKSVRFSSQPLSAVWKSVKLLCNDALDDRDYAELLYGEELGSVVETYAGTLETRDRYLTQYFLPALILAGILIVALVVCTVLIEKLNWTLFAIIISSIALAFIVWQLSYFGNSRRFRRGNPRAVLFLLDEGVLLLTPYTEYALPFEKIAKVYPEPGIRIVCYNAVYSFTPNLNGNAAEYMESKIADIKARKRAIFRGAFSRKGD